MSKKYIMKKLSKKDIFKAPDGYFEELPENILNRFHEQKIKKISFVKRYAAAAIIILGFGIYFLRPAMDLSSGNPIGIDYEIDNYISADYWQAEDILMLADNPNAILDEIILAEWGGFDWEDNEFEEEFWF